MRNYSIRTKKMLGTNPYGPPTNPVAYAESFVSSMGVADALKFGKQIYETSKKVTDNKQDKKQMKLFGFWQTVSGYLQRKYGKN